MGLSDIRALTFDTGGTILDWHTGFKTILSETGAKHGLERNWHDLANAIRRQGLGKMLNLGKDAPPGHNFDGAHRMALEEVIAEHGLEAFTEAERHAIAYEAPHNFDCWPDFPRRAAQASRKLHVRVVHDFKLPHHHGYSPPQWPVLGRCIFV